MQAQESAPFFSKKQISATDHPLSSQGRFTRLSYIAWLGLLQLFFSIAALLLSFTLGVVNFSALHLSQPALSSLSWIGELSYFILCALYIYSLVIVIIRRLHDRNKSGWSILLFLIPIVQFFMMLYLFFARGCNRANRFGHPRPTTFIEKLIAWSMIIVFVIGLFTSVSVVSYLVGSGNIDNPSVILQQGTEYF